MYIVLLLYVYRFTGNVEKLEYYIWQGEGVNSYDSEGLTPLMNASLQVQAYCIFA